MAFRYMNPGYVSLLDRGCTATQVTDSTYSRTGVSFIQTTADKGVVTIPEFTEGDEFWARFDWYLPSNQSRYYLRFMPPNISSGFYIGITSSSAEVLAYRDGSGSQFTPLMTTLRTSGLKLGAINTIVFHLVYGDAATACMECTVNGVKGTLTGEDLRYSANYSQPRVARLHVTSSLTPISNVIFSDSEISPREQVVALPITATDTDMTAGENGLYIANAANQSLLQAVDASALGALHGANSQVTGVALIGNPAYKTAEGLASFTSLSKAGGIVTEHDSFSLSDDTESVIQSSWALSNTTIADLQNMQFGWKAGA